MVPEKITTIEQRAFLRGYQKFEIRPDGDMEVIFKRFSTHNQFKFPLWRERVAHGVSRGLGVLFGTSPGGAAENIHAFPSSVSPLRGFCRFGPITHGSCRALFPGAALRLVLALIALCCFALIPDTHAAPLKTQNVFLAISDGFRWQELFKCTENDLMTKENDSVEDSNP